VRFLQEEDLNGMQLLSRSEETTTENAVTFTNVPAPRHSH